jgi:phage terminase large subunit-like protein
MRSPFRHRVDRYALDVDGGRILAGPLVRLACDRHLRDRHAAAKKAGHPIGLFFHEAAATHIIEFFEGVLRLPDTLDDDGNPIPFLLTPANTFIVGSIFGWKMPTGYRRFREAYVEEGKGNAKTPLAAGIGLYGLTMDGEIAAEIYSVATGIDQARICWRDADRMVEASPDLCDLVYRSADNLAYAATYSWFRPLTKEKRGKSGPRPHMVFFDEEHEYADAVVVNKMRAGMKRRKQPLSLGITNSGFDRTSVCWHHHEHARKMLEGVVDDQRLFAFVCGLDDARTEVYNATRAVQETVNLCTCECAPTILIGRKSREVFADPAISPGIENRELIDALNTQDGPSDQQGFAPSATTESDGSGLNIERKSVNDSGAGRRRTQNASPDTRSNGSQSDQGIDSRRQRSKSSARSGLQTKDSTNSSRRNKGGAPSAECDLDISPSTTITLLERFEGSSVSSATRELVFSEILSRVYAEHSPTCNVRRRARSTGARLTVEYPADDPLTDRTCHIKANPNLGIVIQQEYLDRQVENARNIPSETSTVLRLNFCVWSQAHTPAWDMAKWRQCGALAFTDEDLVGRPCYGGLDLGQNDDFCAWARLWELPDFCVVKMRFWLPRVALTKYPDRPYEQWERATILEVTEGDTTDIDLIEEAVLEDARTDGVLEIAYDKRFAGQLALHLQGAGVTMVDTPQGFALNESIKSVSKLIADVELAHGNHLIMTWMMDNTVLRTGRNKEVRLDKEAAKEKIDGPSALVMANARRIAQVPEVPAEDPDLVVA